MSAADNTAAALVVSRAMRTTPMLAPTDRLLAPHRKRPRQSEALPSVSRIVFT